MAIEKRKNKSGLTYRAYWRNPWTGKIEKGPARETLREARRDDSEIKHNLEYNPDYFRPDDLPAPGHVHTLGHLSTLYLARPDLAPSTRKMDFYHFKTVSPSIGHIPANALTKDDLKEFEKMQRDAGIKQNTIQRRISVVRAIINWAVEQGLIQENPVAGYRCKRGADEKLPPPSPAETRALIDAAPPHLMRAITLSYYFGVRVGESELLQLKWADFDPDRRRFRVWSAQKNKNQPWRDIDVVDSLYGMLLRWYEADQAAGLTHLVTYRGKPIKSIKTAWKTCKEKAGITRRIRPYDLRHAFATEAIANEADLKAVADLMGHATTSMIHRHYQHVVDKQKRKVVESVPDVLKDLQDDEIESAPSGVQPRGTKQDFSGYISYPAKIYFQ